MARKKIGDSYEPAVATVAQELRRAIFEGELKPGTPVRQEAFAKALGVSRIPVREALRLLESEGLVVLRPHSGARVATIGFDECEEIYKMRERLEPLAFAESAQHIDDEQIATARELTTELEQLKGNTSGWLECDRRLHFACYAGVRTPRLLRTIVGLWNATQEAGVGLVAAFDSADYELQQSEHRLMVDLLATGRARAGEDLVRMHVERSRLQLVESPNLFAH